MTVKAGLTLFYAVAVLLSVLLLFVVTLSLFLISISDLTTRQPRGKANCFSFGLSLTVRSRCPVHPRFCPLARGNRFIMRNKADRHKYHARNFISHCMCLKSQKSKVGRTDGRTDRRTDRHSERMTYRVTCTRP